MYYITEFDDQCDFGMRKVKNFFRNQPKPSESTNVNVGYYEDSLVYEVALTGIRKENITVSYNGNVIEIKGTFEKEKNIRYVLNRLHLSDINKRITLVNDYIGGNVKWKFVDGLLTIVVEPFHATQNDGIQPSDDAENFFPDINNDNEQVNIP